MTDKQRQAVRAAAVKLEQAVDAYCDTCADNVDDDGISLVAGILSDRWGTFRFYIAERTAGIRNFAQANKGKKPLAYQYARQ
jgi:hypothetical protein